MVMAKMCPFCGGEPNLYYHYNARKDIYFTYVKCTFCGSSGRTYTTRTNPEKDGWEEGNPACRDALAAWNRRAEEKEE